MRGRNLPGLSALLFLLFSSSVLLPFGQAMCGEDGATRFFFAQLTDTHIGEGDHLERTARVVDALNALPMPLACVVHTGDIMMDNIGDNAVADSALSVLVRLRMPLHYVAGNHDILKKRLDSTRMAYLERFGGLLAHAEYGGVVFLFIYTEPLRKSFTVEGYRPLEELERLLQQFRGRPVIVFHHAPSVDDFYRNRMHAGWKDEVRRQWIDLLNAYGVKAVIAGHFHRDELHWLGDVPLYVASSVAGYWGRQGSYRIYEYDNGKIGYRTQYLEP